MFDIYDLLNELGRAGEKNDSLDTEIGFCPADVHIKDNAYVFVLDLPGVKKEDVKVSFSDKQLKIKARTSEEKVEEKDQKKYLINERYIGEFSRSFYIEKEIDKENIKGKLEDGILTITVPIKEEKEADLKYINID